MSDTGGDSCWQSQAQELRQRISSPEAQAAWPRAPATSRQHRTAGPAAAGPGCDAWSVGRFRAARCRLVPRTAGVGPGDAAGVMAGGGRENARSMRSVTRRARLPTCLMMARSTSRHSGWLPVMPRSRQISAMTAPIGRWRNSAAICSGVGRCARSGSVSAAGGRCSGCGSNPAGPRSRVDVGSAPEHSRFERVRSRPRAMRVRISARSVVPKRALAKIGWAAVRWRIVAAISRP